MREAVFDYISKKYHVSPEFLWKRYPDYAVFRHEDNKKWFALVMDVRREKLGLPGDGWVDIVNVKVDDPMYADILVRQEGFFRGYHISRGNWISILLDGTVPLENVCGMIDTGYLVTASKQKKEKTRPPKEWLIPSNPSYFDIVKAFEEKKELDWKQGAGIRKGDTVYMYVGAPVSAVLYRCLVTETDIPCRYRNKNLTIKNLMKIRLQEKYEPSRFSLAVLREEYGVWGVRGPRSVPAGLSDALQGKK